MYSCPSRIIIIGDAHGDSGRVIEVLKAAKVIDDTLSWIASPPDTFVVQMGDQVDSKTRIPDPNAASWESTPDVALLQFMDNLDSMAMKHGGRVLSLIGNHEIMNVLGDFTYVSQASMEASGGPHERKRMFQPGHMYSNMLAKRYIVLKLGRYLFCHAGLLPAHLNLIGENIDDINKVFRKFIACGTVNTPYEKNILQQIIFDVDGILWTRKYAALSNNEDTLRTMLYIVLKTTRTTTMFIGHNTVDSTVALADQTLVFTDACFSRAYGKDTFQYIDIRGDRMRVIEI